MPLTTSRLARRAAIITTILLVAGGAAPLVPLAAADHSKGHAGPAGDGTVEVGNDRFEMSLAHAAILTGATAQLVALDAQTREEAASEAPSASVPVYYPLDGPQDAANRRFGSDEVIVLAANAPSPGAHGITSVSPVKPGVWSARVADAWAAEDAAAALRSEPGVADAYVALRWFAAPRAIPNDPFFPYQWHLRNTGQLANATAGIDVNITNAWDLVTGQGVLISVVDDGLQYTHPDLAGAYVPAYAYDQCSGDADPAPSPGDGHGTSAGGVAAARAGNGLGVAGAAFLANLTAQRLIACANNDTMQMSALAAGPSAVSVSTNSWGPSDSGTATVRPGPLAYDAITTQSTTGRAGKGIVYTWAAGNGKDNGDHAGYDGYVNHPNVIPVGAIASDGLVAPYSEACACLLVSAPSNSYLGYPGITTTDLVGTDGYNTSSGGDYTHDFGGTSSATPLVAGVVALMLQANANLTARDVQVILALTANRTGLVGGGFTPNGVGIPFSHDFGFGRVDAGRAVQTAASWALLSPPETATVQSIGASPIADNSSTNVTRSFVVGVNMTVEKAILSLNATHPWHNDLRVVLRSPSGTEALLLPGRNTGSTADFVDWKLTANAFLNEPSVGTWTVLVRDIAAQDVGSLGNLTLELRGRAPPSSPAPLQVAIVPNVVQAGSHNVIVYVNDSGSPVTGANLSSTPTNIFPGGAQTDGTGRFQALMNLSAGNYTITASTASPSRTGQAMLQVQPAGGGGGGGGGAPPACPSGSATVSGTFRITGGTFDASKARVAAFVATGDQPEDITCAAGVAVPSGNLSTGATWSIGSLNTDDAFTFVGFLDENNDSFPNDGEVADNVTTAPATGLELLLNLSAGGPGGPGGPAPTPCDGTQSISGEVRVEGQPVTGTVRMRAFGPCAAAWGSGGTPFVLAGNFSIGVPFTLTNLTASSFHIEAFMDQNDDGLLNGMEPVASQVRTAPATNVLLCVACGGGGGGGGGFGGDFNGSAGGISIAGTTYYNGSMANGSYQFDFQPTGGSFGEHRVRSSAGAYNFTGFTAATYNVFAWKETDNIGGPSVREPLGFWILDGEDFGTKPAVDLLQDQVGVNVEFRDPGPDGWDPGMLPSFGGGGPGGPGGPGGGCNAEGGGTVIGHIGDATGAPLAQAFVSIQNQTSFQGEFPQLDANGTGTFSCALAAGSYRVEASSPDHGFNYQEFQLSLGEEQHVWLNLSFDFRPPYSRPTTFYGGTVWGNVTYTNGTGIDGVRVNAFRSAVAGSPGGPGGCQPANPSSLTLSTCGGEGETNTSGSFVITYLGDGAYDLYIDGSGAGLPSRMVNGAFTVAGANSTGEVKLDLGRFNFSAPGYLRGNITRASDDAPVANADVSVWQPCMGPCEGGGGGYDRSNATGYYEIALSPGNYGVHVRAPTGLIDGRRDCNDFDPGLCVNVTAGATTWIDFELASGSTLSGRVLDGEGDPVRAFINVESCGFGPGPCNFYWGQTDFGFPNQGFYNVTVTPGTYRVRIEADRFERPDLASYSNDSVTITEGNTTHLNVTLAGGAAVRGRVMTSDGEPARFVNMRANVHCEPSPGGGGCFGGFGGFGFTDEDGAYSITGLAPGFYDVFAEPSFGSAYMRTELRNVQVNASEDAWRNLTLSSGGVLAGYITAGGTPVQGAHVDAFWQPDFEPGPGPGGPGPGPVDFPTSGGWGHAVTDSTGYYQVRGLAEGTFGMYVRPPFGTSYTSANLEPFRDDLPDVVVGGTTWQNFTLGSGGQIRGCVRNSGNSSGVPFAWVSAFSPAAGFGGGEPTQSDGCFTIRGVRAGTYEVEINPPFNSNDGRTRLRNVVVAEGETTDLGFVLLSAGIRFAGTVSTGSGPLQGAFVNVFQHHDETGGGPGAFGFAVTDAQGRFNISGLVAGDYGAHIQPPFGQGLSAKFIPEIDIPSTGLYNYAITLGGGGWITGQVTVEGVGVRNAWVGAWSFQGGSGGGTITNETGHYNISGLASATDYNFDIMPPYGRQNLAGHHEFPLTVTEGAGTTRNVALEAGGTLIGRVLDASGTGLANAFIDVNANSSFAWGMTDSTGNFSVTGIRASNGTSVTLFVQPGFGSSATPSRFTHTWAGNATGVSDAGSLTLDAGRNISGRITTDGTTGLAGAEIFVMPALPYFGPPIGGSATTSSNGYYNITGLPAGQAWDVRIERSDGPGHFEASAVTTSETTSWYNFSFTAVSSGDLSVLVQNGGGPIDGARVDCSSPTTRDGAGGTTNATGWANFTSLVAGTYTCRAFAANHTGGEANVTVSGGATASHTFTLASVATYTVTGVFSTTNASGPDGYLVLLVPNGTIDATETVLNNVTDAGGNYSFVNVPDGVYDVKVLNSSGRVVIIASVTVAGANVDRDIDGGEG